jgi:quinol monooxygenase YgiN
MLKSITMRAAAVALIVAAWLLLPPRSHDALAQSAPLYISAVDLEIAPASMTKFLAALKLDGDAAMQEPAVREFDTTVSQKDPGHVFIFEVYDNAAAYDAHQKTVAYAKFIATTMMMIKKYNIRPFASVAMNTNATAQPPSGPLLINQVELDIVPAQFDQFMDAAKTNAAASVQDAGCREFNIAVSQNDPHHVLLFEVYDNAAALDAQQATDHFKTYQTITKSMVSNPSITQLSSVEMDVKSQ